MCVLGLGVCFGGGEGGGGGLGVECAHNTAYN